VFVDRAPEKLRESGGLVVGAVNRHRPEDAQAGDRGAAGVAGG
jgi:hypothetical protein